jgi:hypothetical protein
MEKLVFEYSFEGDGLSWHYTAIPFMYSSKEDFCKEVLKNPMHYNKIGLKVYSWDTEDKDDLEPYMTNPENFVFTLEEWFNKNLKESIPYIQETIIF